MTESEARTNAISEVWEEFKSADQNYPRTKHIRDRLRAVLLERCGQIWDADGVDTQITIFKTPSMDCIRVDQGKYVRYDNYETCLNMSAAYAFWAWELKQRQNESNG